MSTPKQEGDFNLLIGATKDKDASIIVLFSHDQLKSYLDLVECQNPDLVDTIRTSLQDAILPKESYFKPVVLFGEVAAEISRCGIYYALSRRIAALHPVPQQG